MTSSVGSAVDQVRELADAVLYEGYLLYPYRASATKNQQRFQFGVLMPPGYADASERKTLHAECVLECAQDSELHVLVRFLQMHRRQSWYEGVEQEQRFTFMASELLDGEATVGFSAAGDGVQRAELDGLLRADLTRLPGPYGALKLRLDVANTTPTEVIEQSGRQEALWHALVAAHVIVEVPGGRFLSPTDPPRWAAGYVAECVNEGGWPVLAGPESRSDLLLVSPIILYDHAEVAAESPAQLYDSTEIDEILLLRTLALTDEEKAEARATDPRAAAVIDRADGLSPEIMDRLHGAIRSVREASDHARPAPSAEPPTHLVTTDPWWDPETDASVSPETDEVVIGGVPVARGSTVVMRPGSRRADAQDLFLSGRPALVEAVLHDVDGNVHLAVTPQDDPDADLHGMHGRFLYFAPDEVEPVLEASAEGSPI
ncbi:hypothetical protein KDK95_12020 [Actinospica sp. MGRD01-02]|uniref:Uncharacterized protein n=1 Tax=Actinospica acidithermotolerans TaxID=2828514 RepID=A0A941EDH4_9ACTN|nr:hypothetical protein [Actinospica acidithermotolerans]MBR7827034.1 hypothetical protein [Actinospica acidithermotolerans]